MGWLESWGGPLGRQRLIAASWSWRLWRATCCPHRSPFVIGENPQASFSKNFAGKPRPVTSCCGPSCNATVTEPNGQARARGATQQRRSDSRALGTRLLGLAVLPGGQASLPINCPPIAASEAELPGPLGQPRQLRQSQAKGAGRASTAGNQPRSSPGPAGRWWFDCSRRPGLAGAQNPTNCPCSGPPAGGDRCDL